MVNANPRDPKRARMHHDREEASQPQALTTRSQRWSLYAIRDMINKSTPPGYSNLYVEAVAGPVAEEIFTESAKGWEKPINDCCKASFKLLETEIAINFDEAFMALKETQEYQKGRIMIKQLTAGFEQQLRADVLKRHKAQLSIMFTLQDDSVNVHRDQEQMNLQMERDHHRGNTGKRTKSTKPDPLEREIGVAAYTIGMYKTVAYGTIDNLCTLFMGECLPAVRAKVDAGYMDNELGLTWDENNGEFNYTQYLQLTIKERI